MASSLNPNAAIYTPPELSLVPYYYSSPSAMLPATRTTCDHYYQYAHFYSYPPQILAPQQHQGMCQEVVLYGGGGGYCSPYYIHCKPKVPFPFPAEMMLTPQPTAVYYCGAPSAAPSPATPRCSITEIVEGRGEEAEKAAEEEERKGKEIEHKAVYRDAGVSGVFWRKRVVATTPPRKSGRRLKEKDLKDYSFKPQEEKTTVMIKNIPNKFAKGRVMAILDQHCCDENEKLTENGGKVVKSEYDFLYLPMDFRTNSNYGYAFVNFTSSAAAWRLHRFLQGHHWNVHRSQKICQVTYARIQGLEGLVKHFSSSSFTCQTDEYLPVRFEPPRDGVCQPEQHIIGRRSSRY